MLPYGLSKQVKHWVGFVGVAVPSLYARHVASNTKAENSGLAGAFSGRCYGDGLYDTHHEAPRCNRWGWREGRGGSCGVGGDVVLRPWGHQPREDS